MPPEASPMTSPPTTPPARVAGPADLDTVTTIIARSFAADPVWGPAFAAAPGDPERTEIWRTYLAAVMRFPATWLSAGDEATSVWVPPGEDELTDVQWDGFVEILRTHLGHDADRVVALFERFDAAHPHDEPHYYLSLLGTHPDHRGAGHGMRLLAENLERIDTEGTAAYLESTNPANNDRYGRVGFEVVGGFEGFVPGSIIATMWRPARR
jgi:ribosomal protein S18 acetylase RimI-like enzyme